MMHVHLDWDIYAVEQWHVNHTQSEHAFGPRGNPGLSHTKHVVTLKRYSDLGFDETITITMWDDQFYELVESLKAHVELFVVVWTCPITQERRYAGGGVKFGSDPHTWPTDKSAATLFPKHAAQLISDCLSNSAVERVKP